MKITANNLTIDFLRKLENQVQRELEVFTRRAIDKKSYLYPNEKKFAKALEAMLNILYKILHHDLAFDYLHPNNYRHDLKFRLSLAKETKKELAVAFKKANKELYTHTVRCDYSTTHPGKIQFGNKFDVYYCDVLKTLDNLLNELIKLYKKKIKENKTKKEEPTQVKTSKNTSSLSTQEKTTVSNNLYLDQSDELLMLTKLMMDMAREEANELFAPFESGYQQKKESETNKLIEYEIAFNKFINFYKKLSIEEKEKQIKKLKRETSAMDREMLFKIDNIDVNNFDINCLSPKSLLQLININVKNTMKQKGGYYYTKYHDHIIDKPLTREYEICNVTIYMEIEEIAQLYRNTKCQLQWFSNDIEYLGLQRNFAMSIYLTLINRGYIKETEKTKDSIIYEICTKILKDESCLFKKCTNTENIDLNVIINLKKYDISKMAFEKTSFFGRLKRNINNNKKENTNAKKL